MTTSKLNRKLSAQRKSTKDLFFFYVQSRQGTLVSCKKYVTWNAEIEITKKPSQKELLPKRKSQTDNNSGELMAYWSMHLV